MKIIALELAQVPAHLRGIDGYNGKRFEACAAESISIPADAGLWSGGSREVYIMVNLSTGETMRVPGQDSSPFDRTPASRVVPIPAGAAMVRHSVFCDKDCGITFYVNPSSVAVLLSAPIDLGLTRTESVVLGVISGLISKVRREYAARKDVRGAEYDAAVQTLKAKGLLSPQGGLTVAGRNAARALSPEFRSH